jgi:hypothetical protein
MSPSFRSITLLTTGYTTTVKKPISPREGHPPD